MEYLQAIKKRVKNILDNIPKPPKIHIPPTVGIGEGDVGGTVWRKFIPTCPTCGTSNSKTIGSNFKVRGVCQSCNISGRGGNKKNLLRAQKVQSEMEKYRSRGV